MPKELNHESVRDWLIKSNVVALDGPEYETEKQLIAGLKTYAKANDIKNVPGVMLLSLTVGSTVEEPDIEKPGVKFAAVGNEKFCASLCKDLGLTGNALVYLYSLHSEILRRSLPLLLNQDKVPVILVNSNLSRKLTGGCHTHDLSKIIPLKDSKAILGAFNGEVG